VSAPTPSPAGSKKTIVQRIKVCAVFVYSLLTERF
jgi:hypothetical protein